MSQLMTESAVITMLVRRYTRISMGAHRYVFADHVPCRPGFADRIADFMVMDCYKGYGSFVHPLHGFEIKCSRADWLTELRDPAKAEAFKPYMDHWWLVVSDRAIVRDGELPADWGLLVVAGGKLRAVKPAPRLTARPLPKPLMAAFLRAVARSARRSDVEVAG